MALRKMKGAFKMAGFNPGANTGMGNSFMKQAAYGSGGETWGEYAKRSGQGEGGEYNLDTVVNSQRAYEAKMRAQDKNWNKKEDNTWKKRQNTINELMDSSKRYEIDPEPEVKERGYSAEIAGVSKEKNVKKDTAADTKSKVVTTEKEIDDPDNPGETIKVETGSKTTGHHKEGGAWEDAESEHYDPDAIQGKVKLKTKGSKKHLDEDGKPLVTRVKGYSTGKKRPGAKLYKENMQLVAKRNRISIRMKDLDKDSKRYKNLQLKLDALPEPKSEQEMATILKGMDSNIEMATGKKDEKK